MDFSPVRVVTPVNIAFVTKSYLEKSQTYRGDGINDDVLYMYTNPGCCLECNFSSVYWFDIIFSVGLHSYHSIDH